MASLTLNDWTVPVRPEGSLKPREAVDRTPASDGTPLLVRSGHKRRWAFSTIPIRDREAEGLIGMLQGKGDRASFETELWTDQGDYPDGTPVAPLTPSVDGQSTPAVIYSEAGYREAKFGNNSLWMGPASENLLSSDSSDGENAPTGFGVVNGSAIAADTTYFIHGAKSCKCTTAASTDSGVSVTQVTGLTATNTYTYAVYVYTSEALSMDVYIDDGSTVTTNAFTSIANSWVRVEVSKAIAGTTADCGVRHKTATAKVFYVDMCQLEELGYGTAWIDRRTAATRAAPDLDYGNICKGSDNLTFAAWVRAKTTEAAGVDNVLFYTDDGNAFDYVKLFRTASTNDIQLTIGRDDGSASVTTISYATTPWDNDWHHIAAMLYANENGALWVGLYYDGTLVANATATYHPFLRGTQTNCYIGNNNGANTWDGRISEALILPYAMSAAQISALASRTTALPQYPKLEAMGDFNMASDFQPEIVEGNVINVPYVGYSDTVAFHSYNRSVEFSLTSEKDI